MSRLNAPQWTPGQSASSGTVCQNCGTKLTRQFARVFGDNRDVAHHCGDCEEISYRDLKWGAGSNPDYDPETDRGSSSENAPIFNRGDFDE